MLVQAALRRPITVLVLAVAVVLGAVLALDRMPRDIFPTLGIPTIYVAQPYGGMDPAQMEGFLTYYYEYHFLYITGIEHVESKSIQGAAIMKLQFYPGTDMNQAMAETVGYVNRARAFMPPGTVPPFITRFDAGSVPVGNLVFTSDAASVAQMQDAALNRVRPLFATLPGVSAPPPFGGSARTILINVDPDRLRSYNMAPDEIVAAITRANLISPSGNMAVSGRYPMVPLNSVVRNIKDLESVPIRTGTYPTVFVRDVGEVVDGSDIVTSYALVDGRRTVYVPVTKRADASTLSVVELVKENLPRFQSAVPEGITVSYELDQSPYVIRAIDGLMFEGLLGAFLTGITVLLFLRDWRSAAIVVVNIPLALLGALLGLWLTGQTVNIMTLGGLALAIGVLVDMSTVVIENVHTHLSSGKRAARAVVDSGREVAVPLLIAMLCVLAVFVPAFFMVGAARALFVPLSLAVAFAMLGSYVLSSTLVPILSVWLLRPGARCTRRRACRLRSRLRRRRRTTRAGTLGRRRRLRGGVRARDRARGRRLGHGDLPARRHRPAPSAAARADRHRRGRHGAVRSASARSHRAAGRPGQRPDHAGFRRRARAELPHQPHLSLERRLGGGRAPSAARGRYGHRHGGAQGGLAPSVRREDARRELLVRAERHREPGDEPRRVHADRDRGERPEPGSES
jgi:multidrug efflux pump subunit AcrB